MIYFIIWLILCFIVANVGSGKKIGYWGTFFVSLILSPLIGLIVGIVSAKKEIVWKCNHCGFEANKESFCEGCGKDEKGYSKEHAVAEVFSLFVRPSCGSFCDFCRFHSDIA